MAEVEVSKLRPAKRGDNTERWEVRRDGAVVGTITKLRIGHTSRPFFSASALAPDGQTVELESDTRFQNRVDKILDFHRDPEKYRGLHWYPKP